MVKMLTQITQINPSAFSQAAVIKLLGVRVM